MKHMTAHQNRDENCEVILSLVFSPVINLIIIHISSTGELTVAEHYVPGCWSNVSSNVLFLVTVY